MNELINMGGKRCKKGISDISEGFNDALRLAADGDELKAYALLLDVVKMSEKSACNLRELVSRYGYPEEGMFGLFEVFMDTIVICTMTALVILLSGVDINFGKAAGAELTITGFTTVYGNWVSIFTAVAMVCFAFSTIIGWGLYGSRCVEFIFGHKSVKIYTIAYALIAIVGATVDLGLVWGISDTFNGFMTVPNLIAVFLLTPTVLKLVKEHFETEK